MSTLRKNLSKEIKCRPTTAVFDLKIRAARAERLLLRGVRVKLSVRFKGEATSLDRATRPIQWIAEHVTAGHPVGDPVIHGDSVDQLFEPGAVRPQMIEHVHNPNDDVPNPPGWDDLLPQYQIEVQVLGTSTGDDQD